MFQTLHAHNPATPALIEPSGRVTSYGDLCRLADDIAAAIPARSLLFAFCENSLASVAGYVGFMRKSAVPLLLDKATEDGLRQNLIETYHPAFLWMPETLASPYPAVFTAEGYTLRKTDLAPHPLHPDLALLINTSGSTGSPQLVRQSAKNLQSNTASIIEYLEITAADRPITTLPMQYVYGLSILNTHLAAGATILLNDMSVISRDFWTFFRDQAATSFGGVPYTYDMLNKIRFFSMDLPSLRTMTQAGGKLLPALHEKFATYAAEQGKNFIVMYGASEATARMGYLPAKKAVEKMGSMGIAIPGGKLWLADEAGNEITAPDIEGELTYAGDNVSLGYAECGADLAKGDERGGVLSTGDMAKMDADGFFTVTGRKKRFLKIAGKRVNLDETERLCRAQFPELDLAVGGVDDLLILFVTDEAAGKEARLFIPEKTHINYAATKLIVLDEIPKNAAGKTLYSALKAYT